MRMHAKNLKIQYFLDTDRLKVLEVGSGDGGQLLAFKEIGCRVLGYEPSLGLCQLTLTSELNTNQGLFTEESDQSLPHDFCEADIIGLTYIFDHLPNPRSFLRDCRTILNQQHGLLVVEVHDFEKIVERREYCLFEHKHSAYLKEATAQQIFRTEIFEIIDFDLIPHEARRVNSLTFVATPQGSDYATRSTSPRTSKMFSDQFFYEQFGADLRHGINNLDAFLNRLNFYIAKYPHNQIKT